MKVDVHPDLSREISMATDYDKHRLEVLAYGLLSMDKYTWLPFLIAGFGLFIGMFGLPWLGLPYPTDIGVRVVLTIVYAAVGYAALVLLLLVVIFGPLKSRKKAALIKIFKHDRSRYLETYYIIRRLDPELIQIAQREQMEF
jgi:hypothetical protein